MSNNLSSILKIYISEFLVLHQHHVVTLHGICIEEMERVLIEVIMEHTQGNQVQASKILGMNRSTLRRKILEYRMEDLLAKVS